MIKEFIFSLLEIFVVSLLLAFSIPYWEEINAASIFETEDISLQSNLQIYILNENEVEILNDEYDFKPVNFIVNNYSNYEQESELLLMYSKLSTLNYSNLKIYINDIEYDLESRYIKSNRNYDVFLIDNIIIGSYENIEYLIYYKVKDNVTFDQILGKYFDSKLEIAQS